jgi:hypothetical protein
MPQCGIEGRLNLKPYRQTDDAWRQAVLIQRRYRHVVEDDHCIRPDRRAMALSEIELIGRRLF